jgi:TPR repeat protein
MKHTIKFVVLGLSLLLANGGIAYAQDFERGYKAAEKGDYATALKEWLPLAEQGDAQAQYNLGLMYNIGQGVPQNYQEALRLYSLAAAQGNADAQSNLGSAYERGRGVPQDYKEALKWYRLAAAQGYDLAQWMLGVMCPSSDNLRLFAV